jgi:hypothetical protein
MLRVCDVVERVRKCAVLIDSHRVEFTKFVQERAFRCRTMTTCHGKPIYRNCVGNRILRKGIFDTQDKQDVHPRASLSIPII